MYCRDCGKENDDNNYKCTGCGAKLHGMTMVGKMPAPQAPPPPQTAPPPQTNNAPNVNIHMNGPAGGMQGNMPPQPSSFLVWNILATLFCCMPLGLLGIIFSAQVGGRYAAGNYAGAQSMSSYAKICFLLALLGGLVCWIIGIIAWGGMVAAAIAENAR